MNVHLHSGGCVEDFIGDKNVTYTDEKREKK